MNITSDRFYDVMGSKLEQIKNAVNGSQLAEGTPTEPIANAEVITDEELEARLPGAQAKAQTIMAEWHNLADQYKPYYRPGVGYVVPNRSYDGSPDGIKDMIYPDSPYDENGLARPVIMPLGEMRDSINRKLFEHALLSGEAGSLSARQSMHTGEETLLNREYFQDEKLLAVNIPKENYLDEGIRRYEQLYKQIQDVSGDAHVIRLVVTELDLAFEAYTKQAFTLAGLSRDDANAAAHDFGKAFRLTLQSGNSIRESYLTALRKLDSVNHEFNNQLRYSAYAVDVSA